MPDFKFSTLPNDRGALSNFTVGDRSAYFLTPDAQTAHKVIGAPLQALSDGFATTGEILQSRAPDLTATGFAKLASETILARVAPPFKASGKAIGDAARDVADRLATYYAPFFSNDQPPAVRVELRQYAKSLPLQTLMEAAQNDGSVAAAIIEGGLAMSGLPADIFERLNRNLAVANATRILAGQRTYKTAPDADDPIGGKPDPDAARAAGEQLISALEAEQSLLADAPQALTSAISIVAIMTDTTRDEAFKLLTA